MFFHMFAVIKLSFLEYGFLVNNSSVGGSVAKARDAAIIPCCLFYSFLLFVCIYDIFNVKLSHNY